MEGTGYFEYDYLDLLKKVADQGYDYPDARRDGVEKRELFGVALRHNILRKGFPLFRGRPTSFKIVRTELCWMLNGRTDLKYLVDRGVNIWNEDGYRFNNPGIPLNLWLEKIKDDDDPENGELGPIYGAQMRDQYLDVLEKLKSGKWNDTGLLVNHWNVDDLPEMALRPCHFAWQVSSPDGVYLDLVYMLRSADLLLGTGYNIAFYALLNQLLAYASGMIPRHVIQVATKAHIYKPHLPAVQELLERPRLGRAAPIVKINKDINYRNPDPDDFKIVGYSAGERLKSFSGILV